MKKLVTKLNKKGQDLSIGTLILIVLGIVVLVILILGFTMGWENLWNKINVFGGGTSSISDVTIACRLALPTSDTYTLCQRTWEIKEGNNPKEPVGCRDPRVLQSLGKATTDNLGCTNYSPYYNNMHGCMQHFRNSDNDRCKNNILHSITEC